MPLLFQQLDYILYAKSVVIVGLMAHKRRNMFTLSPGSMMRPFQHYHYYYYITIQGDDDCREVPA